MACSEIEYLGHRVSKECVQPLESHIQAVKEFPRPKTKKKVRGFIGLGNFYRDFIQDFATIIAPLTELTKKEVDNVVTHAWKEPQQEAFDKIKEALTTECRLYFPDWEDGFTLRTDASRVGIGGSLLEGSRRRFYRSRFPRLANIRSRRISP